MTYNYSTRQKSLVANNEESNVSDLLTNFKKKIPSRFDGLDQKLRNLKDVIIKDLQVANQRLFMHESK